MMSINFGRYRDVRGCLKMARVNFESLGLNMTYVKTFPYEERRIKDPFSSPLYNSLYDPL